MGDLVNLKRFRKRVEREQSAKQADANRARLLAAPNPNARSMRTHRTAPAACRNDTCSKTSIQDNLDGGGRIMKSPVVKRSIVVAGHKTSVSLEEAFWNGMKEISGLART